MDKAHETQFTDLYFVTPCCRQLSSLNDLVYNMPTGFSRFVAAVTDPEEELTGDQIQQVEGVSGMPTRIIYARY